MTCVYLSFFLSPFFSIKPHTSAQVSMLVRKSSIVCEEVSITELQFHPSLKQPAGDVTDRKHTYFAVQAVVQLHERSFGLL